MNCVFHFPNMNNTVVFSAFLEDQLLTLTKLMTEY